MSDSPLAGRRVLVYVGGSVAAFKAGTVVTELRRRGAETRVAMTRAAQNFITPLTLQSLSGNPVADDLWDAASGIVTGDAEHSMRHLSLSTWADVQLCVAASADLIARFALGLADDVVTTTALACEAQLVIAPGMEPAMWIHAATQANVETLLGRGVRFVGPVEGRLASGKEGDGRMAEPAEILTALEAALSR